MTVLNIDPRTRQAPNRDGPTFDGVPSQLPTAKETHHHPTKPSDHPNAKLYFVGTATTLLEWEGIRLMTDPNFLHAGDHVHLGPGVTGTRQTNPAIDLHDLPHIDLVLLSHYHADHFDEKVELSLRRNLPIVTTPHAESHLAYKQPDSEAFTNVHALDFWHSLHVRIEGSKDSNTSGPPRYPSIQITGMPGKHVPEVGGLQTVNDLLQAVPPTNGWMLELGYVGSEANVGNYTEFKSGYRIYISGDTLLISDLKKIPELYTHAGKPIDLMLIHLGGTTIPSPKMPLLMVTMDAKQGIELVKLISADLTIPIHYDDYDVFLSPLSDFKSEVEKAGLQSKVVYLDRGDEYQFEVRKE